MDCRNKPRATWKVSGRSSVFLHCCVVPEIIREMAQRTKSHISVQHFKCLNAGYRVYLQIKVEKWIESYLLSTPSLIPPISHKIPIFITFLHLPLSQSWVDSNPIVSRTVHKGALFCSSLLVHKKTHEKGEQQIGRAKEKEEQKTLHTPKKGRTHKKQQKNDDDLWILIGRWVMHHEEEAGGVSFWMLISDHTNKLISSCFHSYWSRRFCLHIIRLLPIFKIKIAAPQLSVEFAMKVRRL